ncbi:rbr family ring finger and ibr domain-containing [Holotrichia oblita]|uniref:Rbr family ring finger and ibr domain-containing n=1 Tax=Holotrichia oblita TaxID=644536 RepID=A0ACB9TLP0_HOLOL|nr:rbr family ring finger and ibr domain-containing [Holotrichia oblita]
MGSTSSKFKKYLQQGDEFAAMQIYHGSPEFVKSIDPNLSYGEKYNHNTALHFAAKHGMKHLVRTFLYDLGGNPSNRNGLDETVLHSACQLDYTKSFSAQERRASCVKLLLYSNREGIDLSDQDKEGNTPLHWAARTGLKRCVEILITYGASLIIENNDKLTPCEIAVRAAHYDIANLLESATVFGDITHIFNEEDVISEQEEVYSGLRTEDLQEVKDQLIVDISDMLKIPLSSAEALLRNNDWSREVLLDKWMKNPVKCCQLAGVQLSASVLPDFNNVDSNSSPEITCEICFLLINNWEQPIMMSCKHVFCKQCWDSYLTIKIQNGDAHRISCPAYQCYLLVPVELIVKLVSPEMARRYIQFDIKAFVENSKSIKWCPMPGCGRAVRLPDAEQTGALITNKAVSVTSLTVDCGNTHLFCWECLGEAHAPCDCKQWQEWQIKIAKVNPEELQASCSDSENAANIFWLVTNSKPCPNCKSPIEKDEGCNHMKCFKCKLDFCWVCQEPWTKHSSATGGYFRCNRFEAAQKVNEKQDSLMSKALHRNNQMQEMSRFLHFYTRFKNHENNQKLEEAMLVTVRQKMELLACSLGLENSEGKFMEKSVRELLKARRVLCGSYVYGYYLKDDSYNNTIFEATKNELEKATEKLSKKIARSHLRTPKAVIIKTTNLTRRKRHELERVMTHKLIPLETLPVQWKANRHCYSDRELSQTSLWEEYDSDLEEEEPFLQNHGSPNDRQCSVGSNYLGSTAYADYNTELLIALELSRLQIAEEEWRRTKPAQTNAATTPDRGSSIFDSDDESDDQIRITMQVSLQESIYEKNVALSDSGKYVDVKSKRSLLSRDLCAGSSRGTKIEVDGDKIRSHLDFNQNEILAVPSSSTSTKQFVLLDQSYSKEGIYRNQSSVKNITTHNSIKSHIAVCEVWEFDNDDSDSIPSNDHDYKLDVNVNKNDSGITGIIQTEAMSSKCEEIKIRENVLTSLKSEVSSAYPPRTNYSTRNSVNKGDNNSNNIRSSLDDENNYESDKQQTEAINQTSDDDCSRKN